MPTQLQYKFRVLLSGYAYTTLHEFFAAHVRGHRGPQNGLRISAPRRVDQKKNHRHTVRFRFTTQNRTELATRDRGPGRMCLCVASPPCGAVCACIMMLGVGAVHNSQQTHTRRCKWLPWVPPGLWWCQTPSSATQLHSGHVLVCGEYALRCVCMHVGGRGRAQFTANPH